MTREELIGMATTVALGLVVQAGLAVFAVVVLRRLKRQRQDERFLAHVRALPWHEQDGPVLLGVFLTAQIAAASLAPPLTEWLQLSATQAEGVALLMQTVCLPAICLTLFFLLARARGIAPVAFRGPEPRLSTLACAGWGAAYYLAALPFVGIAAAMALAVLYALGFPAERQPIIDVLLSPDLPRWVRIDVTILAVTLVPAVEEAIFRGLLLPLALRQVRPAWAVMGVSAIFAVLHLHVPSLAPLFVLACALSLAYLHTGSLLVPIIMHGLFNGVSLAALYLIGDMPPLMGP